MKGKNRHRLKTSNRGITVEYWYMRDKLI